MPRFRTTPADGVTTESRTSPITGRGFLCVEDEIFRVTRRESLFECVSGCAMVAELKKGRYVYYHCSGGKGTKRTPSRIRGKNNSPRNSRRSPENSSSPNPSRTGYAPHSRNPTSPKHERANRHFGTHNKSTTASTPGLKRCTSTNSTDESPLRSTMKKRQHGARSKQPYSDASTSSGTPRRTTRTRSAPLNRRATSAKHSPPKHQQSNGDCSRCSWSAQPGKTES